MAIWGKEAWWHPITLLFLVTLRTIGAFVVHDQPPSSPYTPQVMARAEQPITLEPYTGNGALPGARRHLLATGPPLQYTPTASNTTLRFTLKDHKAQALDSSQIYSLTVLSLADIAISTAIATGNYDIRHSGQKNSTFATSYRPSDIRFSMSATDGLPIYAVTNVLRAMQDLTHYLYLLELVFEVFSDTSPTSPPIASGSLALESGSEAHPVKGRDLEYVNPSAVNLTSAPSRPPLSPIDPVSRAKYNKLASVAVTYDDLKNPLSIHGQSFADVAVRILANITDLIIANQGDGLLPSRSTDGRRLLRYEDTWDSYLAVSLLPVNPLGINFTLGQAAMTLRDMQNRLNNGPMVESRMRITVDGTMVGWGCLRYTNTSDFRCILPTELSGSRVGSGAANAIHVTMADT